MDVLKKDTVDVLQTIIIFVNAIKDKFLKLPYIMVSKKQMLQFKRFANMQMKTKDIPCMMSTPWSKIRMRGSSPI